MRDEEQSYFATPAEIMELMNIGHARGQFMSMAILLDGVSVVLLLMGLTTSKGWQVQSVLVLTAILIATSSIFIWKMYREESRQGRKIKAQIKARPGRQPDDPDRIISGENLV